MTMTYLGQVGHELTDKGGLLDKVLEQVSDVQAIYLSGSRLNRLNVAPTDYDLFVITKPTLQSIMTGQHKVGHVSVEADGTMVDGKVYDTLKFLDVIVKTNPNTVELFYKAPLYVTPEFAPIAERLATPEMLRKMLLLNPRSFVHAVGGQVKQEGKSFKDGHVPLKRQTKIVVQTLKFERYLQEMLSDGILSSVAQPTHLELYLRIYSLQLEQRPDTDTDDQIVTKRLKELFHQTLLVEFERTARRIEILVDQFDAGQFDIEQEKIDYEEFKDFLML